MWDKEDHFGRWVQGLCALPLLIFAIFELDVVARSPALGIYLIVRCGFLGGAGYVAYRCLRYAITGKNNINRDDY